MILQLLLVALFAVHCPRPGCRFPSRYVPTAGISVDLICGYCGQKYSSSDGLAAVSAGAGDAGRGRVDDMQIRPIDKKEAAR
jgi:hypothetical protein